MLLSATSTITDVALSFILFSSTVQYVLYSYISPEFGLYRCIDKGFPGGYTIIYKSL